MSTDTPVQVRTRNVAPAAAPAPQAATPTTSPTPAIAPAANQPKPAAGAIAPVARTQRAVAAPATREAPQAGAIPDFAQTGAEAERAHEQWQEQQAAAQIERDNAGSRRRYSIDWRRRESGDVLILDQNFPFTIWEHDVLNPSTGMTDHQEPCIAANGKHICPLCGNDRARPAKLRTFLTIIDMRVLTNKNGITTNARRQLLAIDVDSAVHDFYKRIFEREGTLRGVHAIHTRNGGQMSARAGNSFEFVARYTDEQLYDWAVQNNFWGEGKGTDGRVLWAEGEFIQPFDYRRSFNSADPERLNKLYGAVGAGAPVGSAGYQRAAGFGNNAPGVRPQRGGTPAPGGGIMARAGAAPAAPAGGDLDDEAPF